MNIDHFVKGTGSMECLVNPKDLDVQNLQTTLSKVQSLLAVLDSRKS